MLNRISFRLPAMTAVAVLLWVTPASAISLEDCGNIHVEAEAQCTMEVEGGCEVQCTPIACSASLYVGCKGSCNVEASAECTGSCDFDGCVTECERGEFDCSASCQIDCGATCEGNCEGECESADNTTECRGQCQASCKATCQGECDASCDIELPDCDTKCEASCEGSCKAQANVSCQTSCQSEGYLDCRGGCEAECRKPEGAMFCDGQFVDHGGHLEACAASIREHIDGSFSASSSASCENGTCEAEAEAEGEASVTCSVGRGAPGKTSTPWGLTGAALALVLGLRRRRAS